MQRVKSKNRFLTIALNIFESIMLNIIMRAFVKNIIDFDVKKKAIKNLIAIDRFLKVIYNLAKKARKIKLKIKKQMNEEFKIKKLKFYRALIQKLMSST